MSRGWALGGKEFKRTLLEEHSLPEETRAWESSGARQANPRESGFPMPPTVMC
jgi:hypothetical protein